MLWAVPVMWTCRTESLLTFRFRTPVLLTKNFSELFCHHHSVSDPFGVRQRAQQFPPGTSVHRTCRSFHVCVKRSPRISLFALLCFAWGLLGVRSPLTLWGQERKALQSPNTLLAGPTLLKRAAGTASATLLNRPAVSFVKGLAKAVPPKHVRQTMLHNTSQVGKLPSNYDMLTRQSRQTPKHNEHVFKLPKSRSKFLRHQRNVSCV